jgi:hypothetical protein
MSELKVKVVQPKVNKNTNSYKIKTDVVAIETKQQIKQVADFTFKVGTKVKHKEENIVGEVKFVGIDRVAVVWSDNSRERFSLAEAKENLEYVDDAQSQVAPLAPQISDKEEEKENKLTPEVNDVMDMALAALDEEFDEDGEPIQKVDLEKVKLQRENAMLKNAKLSNVTNQMKEKIAKDVVDLAIRKGMIEADDSDQEVMSVMLLNDEEFESYKQSIIDYEDDGSQVTSGYDDPDMSDYEGMTKDEMEGMKLLKKIQNNGGKGIIGDFNKGVAMEIKQGDKDLTPKRSLADLGGGVPRLSWNKEDQEATKQAIAGQQQKSPTFQVADELIANLQAKGKQKEVVAEYSFENKEPQFDLSGFENLAGLKKPLRVSEKPAYCAPTNTKIQDLFADFDWKMGPR